MLCKQWHHRDHCERNIYVPNGYRVCPSCREPVEKTHSCNHMSCKRGKHFCYYCEFGPCNSGGEVSNHMGSANH